MDLGIPPKICWFIYKLISLRKTQFLFNGECSELFLSRKGVPQGSILSPILFNLYVAKLKNFIKKKCEILQFADDIVIYSRSEDLKKSLNIIESSANLLSLHLLSKDLEISPQKSSLVIFTRKSTKYTFPTSINLNGIAINPSLTHRFLGIIPDSKLNGRTHLEYLHTKCSKLCNILKSLRGVW